MNAKERRFVATVWEFYTEHGRHDLPWRTTSNPYHIVVSELMLQQTQVSRVIEKYRSFLRKFPTTIALARAPLGEVLKEWSGLGYNRRAKFLHHAAQVVVNEYKGAFPRTVDGLMQLPGIGPYTAGAVYAFAYNRPISIVETNIRTVYIHHFFPHTALVSDQEILALVTKTLDIQKPRQWYWALMDYGAHLKSLGIKNNAKSKHYTKQSAFKGSLREVRGALLRILIQGSMTLASLQKETGFERDRVISALQGLMRDGMVKKVKTSYAVVVEV